MYGITLSTDCVQASSVNMFKNKIDKYLVKVRRGSGFDDIFCIFANMSCLCIHLVTLFNLPCKKKFVMEFFFLCRKISFFHHPKVFISVK